MPDLTSRLSGNDLGYLRAVADVWGVHCTGKDARELARCLKVAILNPEMLEDMLGGLPEEALNALRQLKSAGGHLPWSAFTRTYGELRPYGPARREREQPHRFPANTTERLWYLALIGREFLRQQEELVEMAILPEEFLPFIPEGGAEYLPISAEIEALEPAETDKVSFAEDKILDDSCTLLSALRRPEETPLPEMWEDLRAFMQALDLIDPKSGQPTAIAKTFLELPRTAALRWLVTEWLSTRKFDELRQVRTLRCEGTWQNDPLRPRRMMARLMGGLAPHVWYSIDYLSTYLMQDQPEFLRPAGASARWMIVDVADEQLLQGLESWPKVETAYLRYLIEGPMYWLGLTALAKRDGETTAFRVSDWFLPLVAGRGESALPEEAEPVRLNQEWELEMTRLTPRMARYQLSRFGDWLESGPERYRFGLSPHSLAQAREQQLTVRHLLRLLKQYVKGSTPPALVKALKRWEEAGRETWLDQPVILRLKEPELFNKLLKSPAAKFFGEPLGERAVTVKPGMEAKLKQALGRLGYLLDGKQDPKP